MMNTTKDPRIPLCTTAYHYSITTGFIKHLLSIFRIHNITIAKYGYRYRFFHSLNIRPVRMSTIHLLLCTPMYGYSSHTCRLNAFCKIHNINRVTIPTDTHFYSNRYINSLNSGFCNTRRAQPTERHLSGFARYLTISKLEREGKNPQQKAVGRSWGSSIGLKEPAESVADKKISVRKAGRVAETVADFNRAKEIFEKLYPGCELLEIGAKKSRWASGVYVHALMRRVDETGRTR